MKSAFMVWEWDDAPDWVRTFSPAYDDVSYVVILPEGVKEVPWWVKTLDSPGGGGDEWKAIIPKGDFAGRTIIAICHA